MKLSAKNYAAIIFVVIAAFLVFYIISRLNGCGNGGTAKVIPTTPAQVIVEQKEKIISDTAAIASWKLKYDSAVQQAEHWKQMQVKASNDYKFIQRNFDELLNSMEQNKPVSDYGQSIMEEYQKLKASQQQKDTASSLVISWLQKGISLKESELNACDTSKKRLSVLLDSTLINLANSQQNTKVLQPRVQFYAGAGINVSPKLGWYISAGVRLKDGTMIDVRSLQLTGQTNYQIGMAKNITLRRP